jgi:ribonucleoside-diphosphate reductase alpha subunit
MYVVTRSGAREPFRFDAIAARIGRLCQADHALGLRALWPGVDPAELTHDLARHVTDGMSTQQLDALSAERCADRCNAHPDFDTLAARIVVSDLHKTHRGVAAVDKLLANAALGDAVRDFCERHRAELARLVRYERDYHLSYFALRTLLRGYLQPGELPQDLFLRVAIGVHHLVDDLDSVRSSYEMFSQLRVTHATPTLFNAGMARAQCSSCFLATVREDSVEGIYRTLTDCALISKYAGGIGLAITNVRAKGTAIRGTQGVSDGVVPMLKNFEATAKYINQGGRRKGSIAVYMEPWHADIEAWLQLRRNDGLEEVRCRELFYGLWVNDLFMHRVRAEAPWSLFSPDDVPELLDAYGDAFDEAYARAEADGRARAVVAARQLWFTPLEKQAQTGMPYMCFKDHANRKSNHQHLGVIRTSNLCTEIMQFSGWNRGTGEYEIAVCNLASVALPPFADAASGVVDYDGVRASAYALACNLDRLIDANYYPVHATRVSNMAHRPIGIGVQGLANLFFKLREPFDSPRAREVNRRVFESIYYGAMQASCDLAERLGTHPSYPGSPVSKGLLQFDMWPDFDHSSLTWPWDALRARIARHGVRNSLVTAPMPTATTAQILGNHEAMEPITSNMYTRRVLSGEFNVINRALIDDLVRLGLWDDAMRQRIVQYEGSVQAIDEIPEDVRRLYRTAFELPPRALLQMAADRAPFVDQSQSLNAFIANPTTRQLSALHMAAWQLGLKTGMYYLRTKGAVGAQKLSLPCEACTA